MFCFTRLYLLVLLLSLSCNALGSIRKYEKKIFSPTKSDLSAARHFAQVLKKIKRGRYTRSDIQKLQNSDRNKTFLTYSEDLNFLKRFLAIKKLPDIHKSCQKYFRAKRASTFRKLLRSSISHLCHKKMLNVILSQKEHDLIDIEKKYLLFNLLYITNYHPKSFSKIIESYMLFDQDKYIAFSNELYHEFISQDYRPSLEILSTLPPSNSFSQYLQERGLSAASETTLYTRELSQIYKQIKNNLNNPRLVKEKINEYVRFNLINKKHISSKKSYRQVEILTRKLATKGYKQQALKLLDSFAKISPINSSLEHRIIFHILWVYLLNDDHQSAAKVVQSKGLLQRYPKLSSRLKFWVPYILRNNGETEAAIKLYHSFVSEGDIDYYSILANKEISIWESSSITPTIKSRKKSKQLNFARHEALNVRRILTWLKLDYISYAELELKQLMGNVKKPNKTSLLYRLAEILNHHDQYLFTFKTLYRALNQNLISYDGKTVKNLFPLAFFKEIKTYSQEVDPIIIISLIRQESAFNPRAKSRVGARGLMQLMPATARQFKKDLKIKKLKDPKTNLKLGVKYLARLLNLYEGNLIHTLSAYNAGEGRVKRWKKELFKSKDPLVNVEAIPFNETQNYVKLIYRNIYFYKYLMNQEIKISSIKDSFYLAVN